MGDVVGTVGVICDDEALIKKTLSKFLDRTFEKYNDYLYEIVEANDGFDCISKIYKLTFLLN